MEPFDLNASIERAYRELPMDRLFEKYGLGEFNDKVARKRKECPFCGRLGTFGPFLIHAKNRWSFGCFYTGCAAHKDQRPHGGDEIGFVAMKENVSRTDAMWLYLAMVGIEKPERLPRQAPRPARAPESDDSEAPIEEPEAPEEPQPEPDFEPPQGGEPSDLDPSGHTEPAAPPETPANVVPFKKKESEPPKKGGGNSGSFGGGDRLRPIWEEFHKLLELRAVDRAKLKKERGFSDALIDKLAFRSNTRTNEAALQVLREKFQMRDLLRAGLWKRGRNGTPVPEPQFMGWGILSKKKTAAGEDEETWGPAERPLLPYFDRFGRVFFVRPHKGNIAKEDPDDDEVCGGHVYCPFLLTELIDKTDGLIVITESEFKAAALFAAGIPALGIPGTSFVRNHLFRDELVKILTDFRVREVVIVFDNENKGTPGLPGFKEDPWDRHDTLKWAKYMAWDLTKKTPRPPALERVRIGMLPDEWRRNDDGIDTGKIDWDTALADFIRRAPSYEEGMARAQKGFWDVINDADLSSEFDKRLTPEVRQIVTKKLGDLWHQPMLPSGGKREERLARRLDQLNGASKPELVYSARSLCKALRACVDSYFERKAPSDKLRARLIKQRDEINDELEDLENSSDADADNKIRRLKLERVLIRELMEGTPSPISNFTVKCEYCLHSVDGVTHRLVRFKDTNGRKSKLLRLPGAAIAGLKDFRTFCNERTQGIASWRGGEKDLQMLHTDMVHFSAYRDIHEVDCYGYHAPTGLWFFGDCAFTKEGQIIMADDSNVFWYEGTGYQIDSSVEDRGEHFDQGAPLLTRGDPEDIPMPDTEEKKGPVAWLFERFQTELFYTVGDYDAWYVLGMAASYAIGPELWNAQSCEPGMWLYGKRGGGKTTIARWVMQLWGFGELTGIRIDRGTTHVGMARNLAQYCFLPFWFDEYRKDVDEQKESVLRGAFDRSGTAKGMMDQSNRTRNVKARTVPVVTGESSSNDAATRSRYGHVLIAATRRLKTNEKQRHETLQKFSRHIHHIGRYIMEHRAEFATRSMRILNLWLEDPAVRSAINDSRSQVVHGVGFACFVALNEMLGLWQEGEMEKSWQAGEKGTTLNLSTNIGAFGGYMMRHATQAFSDVQEETMANKFWSSMVSCIQREVIPKSYFLIEEVVADENGKLQKFRADHLPGAQPKGTPKRVMFIAARAAFDKYSEDHRRTHGTPPPLSYTDIQREISRENFWVKFPNDSRRVHAVYINKIRHSCWAIELAQFPYSQDFEDVLDDPADNT